MKIAIWNNLPSGGGKRALFEMARGLQARGHALASWCPPGEGRDYLPLAGLMPERVVARRVESRRDWHRFVPGRRGFGRHYAALENHVRTCAEEIDAGGYDVVLVANCGQMAVPPIGRFLRTPAVHYCGELMRRLHEGNLRRKEANAIKRLVFKAWDEWQSGCERKDLAAFDLILVNSYYSREVLLREHDQESVVCYLGIDAEMFRGGLVERTRTVVGLGALQQQKDPLTAIEAVGRIPEEERPELVWIGNATDGCYLAGLKEVAERCGVKFTPRQMITDQELVAELGRAAVLLYTSRLEPFGFAPLEANACGTPVVAVAEGGVRETVKDGFNGWLVSERDPVALGEALRRVLGDEVHGRALGENGRRWVGENWTWGKCVERLEGKLVETARRGGGL